MTRRVRLMAFTTFAVCCCAVPWVGGSESDTGKKTITNSIGMKLVLIPAGEFLMGSADSDNEAYDNEKPQHRVRITKPFYLGAYEVTQQEYEAVMGSNPSLSKRATLPVEGVSWEDAVEFCWKLSQKEGQEYRLPTEAEWEYACRAGSTLRYGFGETAESLGDYAWFYGNWGGKTHPVGRKKPNRWGLYDMHGNVWEWCQDWYDPKYYEASAVDDPTGPTRGSNRVIRGGGWSGYAGCTRAAYRLGLGPSDRGNFLGFRLARSVSSSTASR